MKSPKYYDDDFSTSGNIYRERDWYKERTEDLEELCGELLTELHCSEP